MFIKSLRTQFYIMIHQIGFQLSFLVVLLCGMINTAFWLLSNYGGIKEEGIDVAEAFLLNYYSPIVDEFSVISLFLLMLPYCFSGLKNRNLRIDLLHIVRGGNRSYYTAGGVTAFCGTFLAFFLPLLIELLINQIFFSSTGWMANGSSIYGVNGGGGLVGTTINESIVINPGLCIIPIQIYIRHPFLYNTLYALLYSVFMGIASVMMYAVSLYMKKNIYLFFPMYILYFIILRIGDNVHMFVERMVECDFFKYFMVGNNMNLSYIYICSLTICMLIVSVILIIRKSVSDQGVS